MRLGLILGWLFFRCQVALSRDGLTVAEGAPTAKGKAMEPNAGRVRVFTWAADANSGGP